MDRQTDETRLRTINPRRWELIRRSQHQFLTTEEEAELITLQKESLTLINRLHPAPLASDKQLTELGKKIKKAK